METKRRRPRIKRKEKVASSNYVKQRRTFYNGNEKFMSQEEYDERQLRLSNRRDRKRKRHEEKANGNGKN